MGPTLGIDVSPPPSACVIDCTDGQPRSELFKPTIGESADGGFGFGVFRSDKLESQSSEKSEARSSEKSEAQSSSPSPSSSVTSSIGEPDESEDEGEGEEVESNFSGGLGSLGSLEDSLPIKRGLSNYFTGKSKSFGNLSEISTSTVNELKKKENPFNKRRRTLIACKLVRKSAFYGWSTNPTSMPLFPLNEDEGDDEEEEEHEGREKKLKYKSFKASSCFALSDLPEQEE